MRWIAKWILLSWVLLLCGIVLLLEGCSDPTPPPQPLPPVIALCEPGLYVINGHLWRCRDDGRMEPFPLPSPLTKPAEPERPKQPI